LSTRREFLALMAAAAVPLPQLPSPWQKGAFALHTPGQIGFLDVLAKTEGRVHFAGEHTSPWTGWMQAPSNPPAASSLKSTRSELPGC
jgi:hypothetical protein